MTTPWGNPAPDDPNYPPPLPPMPPAYDYPYPPPHLYQQYPGTAPWGSPPPSHPQATTAMVLGILGLACFSFLGPFAIWLGLKSMREIDASGGQLGGRGQAQAGLILGILGTLVLCFFFVMLGVGVLAGLSQSR